MRPLPPVVSFVAPSGTGKTTFLEKLIPALATRGLRVLVIKHDVHRFDVDRPGKDTHRMTQAGAWRVLIANRSKMAVMGRVDGEVPLRSLVERFGDGIDLVITEGYRRSAMPKFLVWRADAQPRRPWPPGTVAGIDNLVGVVTDADHPEAPASARRFPLDDAEPCAAFIVDELFAEQMGTAPPRELTAVVLAGGHSRRMGTDKARLEFRGQPLLPALVERLAAACSGGVIAVKRAGQTLPDLPPETRVVDDLLPDLGPLGGLLTGLTIAPTPWVLLVACDLPLLDAGLIDWMRRHPAWADVVLPMRDEHAEPTHAIYGVRCLGAIKRSILSGELGMGAWLGSLRVARIAEAEWRAVHPSGASFLNVNTPDDLARAEQAAGATA